MQPSERPPGVRVGSIAGVPVYIGRGWALIALVLVALIGPSTAAQRPDLGLLAYGVGVLYALLLLVAILVHEAAHAIAARSFGLPVLRIVADLWGGHTAFESGRSTPGLRRSSPSSARSPTRSWPSSPGLACRPHGGIPGTLVGGSRSSTPPSQGSTSSRGSRSTADSSSSRPSGRRPAAGPRGWSWRAGAGAPSRSWWLPGSSCARRSWAATSTSWTSCGRCSSRPSCGPAHRQPSAGAGRWPP